MPLYEIEQYEIHSQKFHVEANSEAEAIKKLLHGAAEAVDDHLELIGVCNELGLPVDECPELADELRKMGINNDPDVIQSIRSIEEVEQGCTQQRLRERFNRAIDGIESLILACSCAGIAVMAPAFANAIETAVEAVGNDH